MENPENLDTLDLLFAAADNHGEDSGEPDHTIGDLQDMLRAAWNVMSVAQRMQFLRGPTLEGLLEMGARDEFTGEDLAEELEAEVAKMEAEVVAASVEIMRGEFGFYWQTEEEQSEDFYDRADAVVDAHKALKARQAEAG